MMLCAGATSRWTAMAILMTTLAAALAINISSEGFAEDHSASANTGWVRS
jgi:uncharacterized membrane protein YphA (DoxX/SURF4 family)